VEEMHQNLDTFREMAPDNADSDISFRVSTEIPEEQFNALMASIDAPELTSARKIVTRG